MAGLNSADDTLLRFATTLSLDEFLYHHRSFILAADLGPISFSQSRENLTRSLAAKIGRPSSLRPGGRVGRRRRNDRRRSSGADQASGCEEALEFHRVNHAGDQRGPFCRLGGLSVEF